ncbi:phage tail tape measure protein [Mediterraneibacter gnavus]|uniref:phage tail tape measure protein n=1 Tax=Mediterraneibacter gnavus TaxID=33038 RepID=UPI0036D23D53
MAANRIKGITIEIGGDTTKLQTALKGVNTEIRNTQSQLKDVEKLLKLDPGNTELLSQKHKLLAQAVSETKEKLETLKTAAEQANTALANGEISQSQYDALQREIVETEQELKRLEEQANQSATAMQKIAATGEQLKNVGGNIESAGKKLLPVTATVTALGTASVKTAADFEAAMSKVAAVSGASASEMEALTAKAREMGSKTKFSASEAAEAMNYMAMAGWKTEDMLSGIEGVMNLAAASGEDLATTSDIVTDALTAFGLTAQDSGHFADVLAAASSNANTNVSMMGETFKYCAPIAGSLGFSVEDTAEAIGLMANAGIKSTQAGTSLRTIMTNLSGEVKICGDSIGEVTIATSNADGSMRDLSDILADCRIAFAGLSESEKAAAAESLVGKNAMSGFLALMNAGEGDINKLSGAIDGCDGAAQKMADTMNNNLEGQLTILKSALEELAISFGQLLIPALREVVQWLQGFIGFLNSLPEGVKKTIMVIALVAAALGPVLIIVGKVISAIGTIMTIVPKVAGVINVVKGAFAALNATMLANPIVLIIAAIAALVAAFIYLWNNCDGFRQFWIDLWENIKQIAVAVWEGLKTFFTAAWQAISTTAQTIWNGIKNFFSALWEGIKTIFTTVLNVIKTIVTTYFNVYKTIITTVFNAIKTVITTVLGAIQTVITTVWNTIKNVFTTVLNTIKSVVSGAFNAMWNGIKNTISGIVNTIKMGFNNAVNFIKNLASSAFSWGADIINGIVNGIRSCIGKIKDAVGDVAETIRSFLHFSVPDEGPLTDYESWMPDFMSGLAKGIEKSKGMVKDAVGGLAADMVVNPQMNAGQMAMAGGGSVSSADLSSLVGSIREAVSGASDNNGDIVIPVYLGGTMLDEVIVNAQQRANLRSGGR